jgi:predicted pyridoxine 5'-phosphate oxidase superfamily flavin-nucleotide-binding protein
MLFGEPGFVSTPDAATVRVGAMPRAADALAETIVAGRHLALLGIDYLARQRIRANGVVALVTGTEFSLHVNQTFGNCPKYIPPRDWPGRRRVTGNGSRAEILTDLDDAAWALIEGAETFFLATASGVLGEADVSHRGGSAGFLRRGGRGEILLPDYRGNFFFNSIGNLLNWPQAGLVFADEAGGDMLQITAFVEVIWEGPEVAAFPRAERLLRIVPRGARWLRGREDVLL